MPPKEGEKDRKEKKGKKENTGKVRKKVSGSKRVSFPLPDDVVPSGNVSPNEEQPSTHSSVKPRPEPKAAPAAEVAKPPPVPAPALEPEEEQYTSEFDTIDRQNRAYFEPHVIEIAPDEYDFDVGTPALPGQVYNEQGRLHWSNNMDFLLSMIGFAVDVANVWGFPYFCLTHGGLTFLIPYTIMLVFCVIPVLYMELIMGQFVQQGSISVWKLCPLFKGVGWCMVMVSYFVSFYYNVVLAWALTYIYESLAYSEIRWVKCDNPWNVQPCASGNEDDGNMMNGTEDSSKQFFKRRVLTLEDKANSTYDLNSLGAPNVGLSLALLFVYAVLFTCLLFGIKITGKVVWVTATIPYIVLGLLLFRGITLPGSSNGLYQFMAPKFSALLTRQIWIDATLQVFFSAGAGFGVHLTFASFNGFQHNLLRDCIVTMMVNAGTSVLSGMVVFSYLGNVAYSTRRDLNAIAEHPGPELVFEAFPSAIGRLPGASFFSSVFFLMVFLIGIDSAMGAMASILTAIGDEFRNCFIFHPRLRPTFIFTCIAVSYLISITMATPGGIYLYIIFNKTAASVALMTAVFLQTIAIAYVYGMKELCDAIQAMSGRRPGIFFNICWKFVTPGLLIVIIGIGVEELFFQPIEFENKKVPAWGNALGIIIALGPILTVPIVGVHSIFSIPAKSFGLRFKLAITPDHEYDEVLKSGVTKRTTKKHLFYFEFTRKKSRRVAPAPLA